MASFSTFIDSDNKRWQFKSGFDYNQDEFRIGDKVPFFKDENLAMRIVWEDAVHDAVLEGTGCNTCGWVVIKDHCIKAFVPAYDAEDRNEQFRWLNAIHNILPPKLSDWEAEAVIAYHRAEIEKLTKWIAVRDDIAKTAGVGWHRKEGAALRLKMRQHSIIGKILPPKPITKPEEV